MSNHQNIIQKKNVSIGFSLRYSLLLFPTILGIWFWTNNPLLAKYNLQLTCLVVLAYFANRLFNRRQSIAHPNRLILETNIIVATLLLIVSYTGGLNSPLFFLIYFLLFAAALILEIPATLITTLVVVIFFGDSLNSSRAAIQLLSLLLFSPLAIYFGKQYDNLLIAKQQLKHLHKDNLNMSNNITKEESLILPWLTLNFKNTLIKMVHITSEMLAEIGSLKPRQTDKLKEILNDSKELLKSGEKLKEEIDKTTD